MGAVNLGVELCSGRGCVVTSWSMEPAGNPKALIDLNCPCVLTQAVRSARIWRWALWNSGAALLWSWVLAQGWWAPVAAYFQVVESRAPSHCVNGGIRLFMIANPLSVSLLLGYCPSPCTYYESQATTAMPAPGRLIPSLSVSHPVIYDSHWRCFAHFNSVMILRRLNSKELSIQQF